MVCPEAAIVTSEPNFLPVRDHHGVAHAARMRAVYAVVWHQGRLLLTRQPTAGGSGSLWALPGGPIAAGESPEHAAVSALRQGLGLAGRPLEILEIDTVDDPQAHELEIHFVRCELERFDLESETDARWVDPHAVELEAVVAGAREFIRTLTRQPR